MCPAKVEVGRPGGHSDPQSILWRVGQAKQGGSDPTAMAWRTACAPSPMVFSSLHGPIPIILAVTRLGLSAKRMLAVARERALLEMQSHGVAGCFPPLAPLPTVAPHAPMYFLVLTICKVIYDIVVRSLYIGDCFVTSNPQRWTTHPLFARWLQSAVLSAGLRQRPTIRVAGSRIGDCNHCPNGLTF